MPRDLLIQWCHTQVLKCLLTDTLTYLWSAEILRAKNSSGCDVSNVCNPLQVTHYHPSLSEIRKPR